MERQPERETDRKMPPDRGAAFFIPGKRKSPGLLGQWHMLLQTEEIVAVFCRAIAINRPHEVHINGFRRAFVVYETGLFSWAAL